MKVVMLQTAIGDYWQPFLKLLVGEFGEDFHISPGPVYFDGTTKTRASLGGHLTLVKSLVLVDKRLLFQTGMWKAVSDADAAILETNRRVLSVWLLLLLRRIQGKKCVLWGAPPTPKLAAFRKDQSEEAFTRAEQRNCATHQKTSN